MRKCQRCGESFENNRFEFDDVDICMDCGDEIREFAENETFLSECIDQDIDT